MNFKNKTVKRLRTYRNAKEKKRARSRKEGEIEAVGCCPPVKFTNPGHVRGSLFFAQYSTASSG